MPWLLGGLAVLLVLGCGLFGALLFGTGPEKSSQINVPLPTSNPPLPSKAPAPVAKPKPAVAGIAEGGYYVGDDVSAGRYRTAGAVKGLVTFCYWEVRPDGDPDGKIGTVGTVDSVGQQADVTLRKGDYFKTTGCERWTKR
jgi:hypothetical protein